jgi:hypothetical protein
MKVVWELENWKKAEEAKFLFALKQKEIDFLTKLNDDWKKREIDREKLFKNHEANIVSIESRLKTKALELQKRENRIVLIETEYKAKTDEILSELNRKDEDIKQIKLAHSEALKKSAAANKNLEKQLENLATSLKAKDKEIASLKKEIEVNPLTKLKKEIQEKAQKIDTLQAELAKYQELNGEYKDYLAILQEEIRKLKEENETIKAKNSMASTREIDGLKMKLLEITQNMRGENLQDLRKELMDMRSGKPEPQTEKKSIRERIDSVKENSNGSNYELARLLSEKRSLVELGIGEDDILLKEINEAIERARAG